MSRSCSYSWINKDVARITVVISSYSTCTYFWGDRNDQPVDFQCIIWSFLNKFLKKIECTCYRNPRRDANKCIYVKLMWSVIIILDDHFHTLFSLKLKIIYSSKLQKPPHPPKVSSVLLCPECLLTCPKNVIMVGSLCPMVSILEVFYPEYLHGNQKI